MSANIYYNDDKRFDLKLSRALISEKKLGDIFEHGTIEKVELKTELGKWEDTGNICIEFRYRGAPSGIATTQADYWVQELTRDDVTLGYLMFPIEKFKQICRAAYLRGDVRFGIGDYGYSDVVLLKLSDLLYV